MDHRLNERCLGDINDLEIDFWVKQYLDFNYKNTNGESLAETAQRMCNSISKILNNMKNGDKTIIVSYATAICSYLSTFCKITVTDEKQKIRKIEYKNKIVLEGKISMPSIFCLIFNEEKLINIQYME